MSHISVSKYLPASLKSLLNQLTCNLKDGLDAISGRRDPLIPPRRLMFDGPKDPAIFKANGQEFLDYYLELCKLNPDEKMLDVGSGIGRKTIPLTTYFSEQGQYHGLDINQQGIAWCQKNISSVYPNFHFQWANVYNQRYNPTGKYPASEYRFPFEDDSFDLVVLGSVFTHLVPQDLSNYLQEVARVLKPETGRCLISYFLLNAESRQLINSGHSAVDIRHDMGGYFTNHPHLPEDAIGYAEETIFNLYQEKGLQIKEPVHYGSWCGRKEFLSFQDLILAYKLG